MMMEAPPDFLFNVPPALTKAALNDLLIHCVIHKASDIKLQPDRPILAKINGSIVPITRRNLGDNEVRMMISEIYGANATAQLSSGEAIDPAYEVNPDRMTSYRFRVNATACRVMGGDGMQITLRSLPSKPPKWEDLEIEQEITDNFTPKQGMVLIVGATGSGKSTLLAAGIAGVLENKDDHDIQTYEAPVEFTYDSCNIRSTNIISQSEVGRHIKSFAMGVRASMRRSPTIILVGESRDVETMSATTEAALTGHLCYSTVHANGVAETIRRMINSFPEGERNSRAVDILESLRMIVAQRLVKNPQGGRTALREWLVFNDEVRDRLFSVPVDQMSTMTRKIVIERQQTFLDAADRARADNRITEEEYRHLLVGQKAVNQDEHLA